MSRLQPKEQHGCYKPGCNLKFDFIPVLVVPSSPFSRNKAYEGVRTVLWLPLCRMHFGLATVREFLSGGVVDDMRLSIEADFRANGAIADWNKAAVQKLGKHSPEFITHERIFLEVRGGTPADIAVASAAGKPN